MIAAVGVPGHIRPRCWFLGYNNFKSFVRISWLPNCFRQSLLSASLTLRRAQQRGPDSHYKYAKFGYDRYHNLTGLGWTWSAAAYGPINTHSAIFWLNGAEQQCDRKERRIRKKQ
jgi:hypothetical protein